MAHNHDNHDNHDNHHSHPAVGTYLKVALALFALTILTIVCHQLPLGAFKAPVAFLIAAIKAFLVMAWFMHMKDDTLLNRIIFGSGFFFLALLFLISALDIGTRALEHSTL